MIVKRNKSNKGDRIVSWMASGVGDKDVHGAGHQGSNFRPGWKYESKEGLQGLKLILFSSRVTALSDENHYIIPTAPHPYYKFKVKASGTFPSNIPKWLIDENAVAKVANNESTFGIR
jgi:hypothetical protein